MKQRSGARDVDVSCPPLLHDYNTGVGGVDLTIDKENFTVLFYFCFICHFYPPFTRKRIVSLYFGREVRTRLGVAFFEVYVSPVFHIKVGRPVKCLAQGHNKRTCRLVLHNLP